MDDGVIMQMGVHELRLIITNLAICQPLSSLANDLRSNLSRLSILRDSALSNCSGGGNRSYLVVVCGVVISILQLVLGIHP